MDWSLLERDYADPYTTNYPYYHNPAPNWQTAPAQEQTSQEHLALLLSKQEICQNEQFVPKRETPREQRCRVEKQRRDMMNHSISQLATIVPPVANSGRKIDKTSILRLTAHYLRSHQYVFGDSLENRNGSFSSGFTKILMSTLRGFLITTTYRGIVVVVSPNIQEYLGYTELEMLGQNIFTYINEQDHDILRTQLMPPDSFLGKNGELLLPSGDTPGSYDPGGRNKVAEALSKERRNFTIRFKKMHHQRSEPAKYVTCHVEGAFRMSDKAGPKFNRFCQTLRRARFRGENTKCSGNDIVFIGIVRPTVETFMSEKVLESFKMEYRTRHSTNAEIIQCEQRIALVTGYMTHEVNGVNALNFIHRDDVQWVLIALREMYVQNQVVGESCYRLMTKSGKFIYMRTVGKLDVENSTDCGTSLVCLNTVVSEDEGTMLIRMMKRKFQLLVGRKDEEDTIEEDNEVLDKKLLPVEDPIQLQDVNLHLVTNLPKEDNSQFIELLHSGCITSQHLSIIAPEKDRRLNLPSNKDFLEGIEKKDKLRHLSKPRVTKSLKIKKYNKRKQSKIISLCQIGIQNMVIPDNNTSNTNVEIDPDQNTVNMLPIIPVTSTAAATTVSTAPVVTAPQILLTSSTSTAPSIQVSSSAPIPIPMIASSRLRRRARLEYVARVNHSFFQQPEDMDDPFLNFNTGQNARATTTPMVTVPYVESDPDSPLRVYDFSEEPALVPISSSSNAYKRGGRLLPMLSPTNQTRAIANQTPQEEQENDDRQVSPDLIQQLDSLQDNIEVGDININVTINHEEALSVLNKILKSNENIEDIEIDTMYLEYLDESISATKPAQPAVEKMEEDDADCSEDTNEKDQEKN